MRRYFGVALSGIGLGLARFVTGQSPVKVRLLSNLFPAPLITVGTRRGHTLEDLEIAEIYCNEILKIHSGGSAAHPPLRPGETIDLFVRKEGSAIPEGTADRTREFVRFGQDQPLLVQVKWGLVDGARVPGSIFILWSQRDYTEGRSPFVVEGHAADTLEDYVNKRSGVIPAEIIAIRRRRVRGLGRLGAARRVSMERERMSILENRSPVRARSISIEGFRGFRERMQLDLAQPNGEPGSGLTFVVGANNTGKSTIWESFEAIARSQKTEVSFSASRRNLSSPEGVRLGLEFDGGQSLLLASLNSETSEISADWIPSRPGSPIEPGSNLEIVSVPSRRQFQASFSRGGTAERDWMSTHTEFSRVRQNDQFTGRLFDLHRDREKKEKFDSLLAEVLGYELRWTIDLGEGQHGQTYYLKVINGEGVHHTSEGLGDGVISLLFILNALYDSEQSTLLVFDEPELSLHPQLVKRLGRVLARYAADRQIVVFTHSPQLVSWDDIANGAEIARVFKVGADSQVAQAGRATIDNVSKARGGWRNPHTLGVDANEILFLDDGVIVVEGQEDAALLPRVFELAGVKFVGTIFGWGSGGEGNVAKITELLQELGFKRVAVVLDNNVPDTLRAIKDSYPDYFVTCIPAPDIRDKPETETRKVEGLLDKAGRQLKPELREEATEVLSKVSEYLGVDLAVQTSD